MKKGMEGIMAVYAILDMQVKDSEKYAKYQE